MPLTSDHALISTAMTSSCDCGQIFGVYSKSAMKLEKFWCIVVHPTNFCGSCPRGCSIGF